MDSEHLSTTSEIHELEMLLASIQEANLIERLSLESRLKSAKKSLQIILESTELAPEENPTDSAPKLDLPTYRELAKCLGVTEQAVKQYPKRKRELMLKGLMIEKKRKDFR